MKTHYLHYPHLTMAEAHPPSVIAIGVFDGVHGGHRQVIGAGQRIAAARGWASAVFTFVGHPRAVLRPDRPTPLLTPWEEKLARLSELGVDTCIAAHFTPDLAQLAPEDFVTRILLGQFNARAVVTGFNFAFGHKQAGTPALLQELGKRHGFEVQVVNPIEGQGQLISSSRLRELIATGHVVEAADLLGKPYTLRGTVVHGDKRGRTIGFPTANLELPPEKLLPAYGVYACWVHWRGERLPGVVNIGQRPTFDPPQLRVEVHLLDWSGDLYGETLTLSLVSRLRDEQAFPGIEALVAQINRDCDQARATLGQKSGV